MKTAVKIDVDSPGRGSTPIHYQYGYVPPKGVVILRLLIQYGVSISEAFSRTGYNISNARKLSTFVSSHLKVFKDRLLLKIRFNALTSKPLYSCCTLERSIKIGPFLERDISFRANSRTGYKKLAYFQNGVSIVGKFFSRTGCHFGVPGGTCPPKKYPSAPPPPERGPDHRKIPGTKPHEEPHKVPLLITLGDGNVAICNNYRPL